jgi:Amt family ammonium transporter
MRLPDGVDAAGAAVLAEANAHAQLLADRAWVLVAACLVFFMQVGFLALEVGFVRRKAIVITAMKNVVDWVVCCLAFFFAGWGLMFGHTVDGLVGGSGWLLAGGDGGHAIGIGIHFLFNLAFAGTAATIVSGAMAERTAFVPYVISSAVVTAIIYPVVGHWIWGNGFFAGNSTLLTQWGFIDFAGSTVVHSVGGWVSLIGIIVVGPRIGRFDADGQPVNLGNYSLAWSGMGVLILWFGWWGFNGGSTLRLDGSVAGIIVNTNVAAAAGGFAAMIHGTLAQAGRDLTAKFMGGLLAGLVAITASCHIVSPVAAVAIGVVAGVLHNIALEAMVRFRLDDPVGAVPVHLACGIWGTLAVGIFGRADAFLPGQSRLAQIGVQALGVGIVAAWTVFASLLTFLLLRRYVGLRVSAHEELVGYDLGGELPADDGLGELPLAEGT